ncbi:helicase-related protein [Microbacterium sp.]|uniref:helicase-related protein n=1 Tax=Microbacterium sp. TaxID=51671 RepID=UPI003F9CA322
MAAFDASTVMEGLKAFQQDTVNHVFDRFYGPSSADASGRFLVADETGLGKSIVARGVIARAIEHLENVDDIDRIDIVYICSNVDLAAQNLRRLNVTDREHIGMTTRLTMLAKESRRLNEQAPGTGKKVNLVSFTPGTSFSDGGWRQGSAPERAMLTLILDQLVNETSSDRRITRMLMQGAVRSKSSFRYTINHLKDDLHGSPDPVIVGAFEKLIRADGSLTQFLTLREQLRGKQKLPAELWQETQKLIAAFRHSLAKAGVDTLEPDLIILDEFQRFRQLLDPRTGDAAELAHALFDHADARVLLLSATPYKPFTNASDTEDDHYKDFLATVRFLAGGEEGAEGKAAQALADYRQSLVLGQDAHVPAQQVRNELLPLMTRCERPPIGEREDMVRVRNLATANPTVADLKGWSALRELGATVNAPIDLEYWKSVPYFASFMDGYKPAERLRQRLAEADPLAVTALGAARTLPAQSLENFDPIDFGNGNLRALADETVSAGWWKLLWIPPTMPYLAPGQIFEPLSDGSVTKQVLFSAWTAAPTAIASLLSYEADRLAAGDKELLRSNNPEARRAVSARLQYRLNEGRPAAMSTLSLFWPHAALASRNDELSAARAAQGRVQSSDFMASFATASDQVPAEQAWQAYFSVAGFVPEGISAADIDTLTIREDVEASAGFREHVAAAVSTEDAAFHPDLADLAAFAPGNIAFRALKAISGPEATAAGAWKAAFVLAEGLRTLFNRTETIALLETLYSETQPYWKYVLAYCADGNLRAVLDEYLFQLVSELGTVELDDRGLMLIAQRAAEAMSLRPARYVARDNSPERNEISLSARFAVRYGGRQESDANEQAGIRQGEVRAAFNSPFAPFVLASTSVGQEGIDFHWWSHSVVHWNLPSNPVDFEQREGRVNRFAGHAVRKNVAQKHWPQVLKSSDLRAWRAAFDAAAGEDTTLGEFSPWWMYPGPARIHRVLSWYPLSRDIDRYERLRSALTLYRLTLGQPRQEDMVEMLARRGVDATGLPTIDLRPPRRIVRAVDATAS